jgi:hypothetical protein
VLRSAVFFALRRGVATLRSNEAVSAQSTRRTHDINGNISTISLQKLPHIIRTQRYFVKMLYRKQGGQSFGARHSRVDGDKFSIIRKREIYEDLTSLEK